MITAVAAELRASSVCTVKSTSILSNPNNRNDTPSIAAITTPDNGLEEDPIIPVIYPAILEQIKPQTKAKMAKKAVADQNNPLETGM